MLLIQCPGHGDELSYTWETETGTITELNNPSTIWEIPSKIEESNVRLKLTVSDGIETSTQTKSLRINDGITISGYAYYKDTKIPVTDLIVSVGNLITMTDSLGYYELEHVAEGENTIIADNAGYDKNEIIAEISEENTDFNFDITSTEFTKKVYGKVQTVDGIFSDKIKVILLNPDETESDIFAISDVTGSYQLSNVPIGERKIILQNDGSSLDFKSDEYTINMEYTDVYYNPRIYILRNQKLNILNTDNLVITGNCTVESSKLMIRDEGSIQYILPNPLPNDAIGYYSDNDIRIKVVGSLNCNARMRWYFDNTYVYWRVNSYSNQAYFSLTHRYAIKQNNVSLLWYLLYNSDSYLWEISEVILYYYW